MADDPLNPLNDTQGSTLGVASTGPLGDGVGLEDTGRADFRLPISDEMELERIEDARLFNKYQRYREGVLRAKDGAVRRDYIGVGPVALHENPKDYLAFRYTATTLQAKGGVPFDTADYPAFDMLVANSAGIEAIANRDHPDYENYAAMRMNIALVRNIICNQYFSDGRFNTDDEVDQKKRDHLTKMAETLGKAIVNGEFFDNLPVGGDTLHALSHIPKNFANIPDEGAAKMYRYLYDKQNSSLFSGWGLLPPEQTAVSQQSLDEFYDATADLQGLEGRLSDFLIQRADETRDSALRLADRNLSPEQLSESDKRASIHEAEKILRYFKVQYKAASLGADGKELSSEAMGEDHLPQESVNITNAVVALTKQYEGMLCQLLSKRGGWDPELLAIHRDATNTIGELTGALRNRAMMAILLEVGDPRANEKMDYLAGKFACDAQGHPLPEHWMRQHGNEPRPLLRMVNQLMTDVRAVDAQLRSQGVDQAGVGQALATTSRSQSLSETSDTAAKLALAGLVPTDQQHIFANAVRAIQEQQKKSEQLIGSGVQPVTTGKGSTVESILAARSNAQASTGQSNAQQQQMQQDMANLTQQQQQQNQPQQSGQPPQGPQNAQQQQQAQEQQRQQQAAREMRAEHRARQALRQQQQQQRNQQRSATEQQTNQRRNLADLRRQAAQNRLNQRRVQTHTQPTTLPQRVDGLGTRPAANRAQPSRGSNQQTTMGVGGAALPMDGANQPTRPQAVRPVVENVTSVGAPTLPDGTQLPPRINRNSITR